MSIKIKSLLPDYPEIYDLIKLRTEEQGKNFNDEWGIVKSCGRDGFVWSDTIEGHHFWKSVNQGDFQIFYDRYPKKELQSLPEKWYIKNDYQEVRDYLADKYDIPGIKHGWTTYEYIGWDNSRHNKGCHGAPKSLFTDGSIEITIEQFRRFVQPKTSKRIPDNWCVKITKSNYEILSKWRTNGSLSASRSDGNNGYICHKGFNNYEDIQGYWVQDIPKKCVEISYEDFLEYVYREPVENKEEVEKLRRKKLLEFAITHYPPGTKYKCAKQTTPSTFEVDKDSEIKFFKPYKDEIDIYGKGFIYANGEWAEIVKEIKPTETVLEKAKQLYPVGTTFISPEDGKQYTVSQNYHYQGSSLFGYGTCLVCVKETSANQYVYFKDKWAKIIEKDEVKEESKNSFINLGSSVIDLGSSIVNGISGDIQCIPSEEFKKKYVIGTDNYLKSISKSKSQIEVKMLPVKKIKVRNNQNN